MVIPHSQLDKLPPDPDLQTVGKVVNRNYIIYHITKQQLLDLQEWVSKQSQIKE